MQVSPLYLAASLVAIASVWSGPSRRGCRRRPGNLSGTMLGLPFQPTRRERHRPFACRGRRTESRIAARLPLHPGDQRLRTDLGCQDLHPIPGRPDQARARHGDDGDGARRDWPRQSLRLSCHAQRHDRSRRSRAGPAVAQDHRSHPGRAQRGRRPRPTPGSTPRTIMPGRVSSISIRSRRPTPRTCGQCASIARSSQPQCRRARSSMAG